MHVPVLLNEIIENSKSAPHPVRWIWDTTLGRGGHTRAFLEAFPQAKVVATDRDDEALKAVPPTERLLIEKFNFHNGPDVFKLPSVQAAGIHQFDLVLMDLGVSSPQLDDPKRGFSFYHQGPLDMRMDLEQSLSAKDIVNTWSEPELLQLFIDYGEVRRPHRTVKRIIEARGERPFETTAQLSSLIEHSEGWQKRGHHPATRYFLALRMAVNSELSGLETVLPAMMEKVLSPGGRLMVITFHSLEDRIVKWIFKNAKETGFQVHKKVVVPAREEILANPRSRSAKLRVFQRND